MAVTAPEPTRDENLARSKPPAADTPSGAADTPSGAVDHGDGRVTFGLWAPWKKGVHLVGDFNNWDAKILC